MTIKDIAKECGCAIGTVSRVMNNHPDVSEKTRQKVLEVVNKHGFVLNQNAKQLKAQDNKTLLIFVGGTSSVLLTSILEKIQQQLTSHDYNTRVIVLDEYENECEVATRMFFEQKPVGIIFLGGWPEHFREDFEKIKCPCVLISSYAGDTDFDNLSSICTNDFEGSKCAAAYLIKKGHRKIGAIGGDVSTSDLSTVRYNGFLEALKESGVSFNAEKSYAVAKYSFESGFDAARRLLEKDPDITAIFCMSDVMAIGAIRYLKNIGRSVPDDISIIGYDGISLADYYCPKLTTIKQLDNDLAKIGLGTILDAIEKKAPSKHQLIPFEFIEGESVKQL